MWGGKLQSKAVAHCVTSPPSLPPSLPPFFYHLSLLWRLRPAAGCSVKTDTLNHTLINHKPEGPESAVLPRGRRWQERGGDFTKLALFNFLWGEVNVRTTADREKFRSGRQDSPTTCHLKTNCCCPFTLPSEWLKKDWVCVWLFSDCPAPICLFSCGIHTWPHQTPIKNEANLKRTVQ